LTAIHGYINRTWIQNIAMRRLVKLTVSAGMISKLASFQSNILKLVLISRHEYLKTVGFNEGLYVAKASQ